MAQGQGGADAPAPDIRRTVDPAGLGNRRTLAGDKAGEAEVGGDQGRDKGPVIGARRPRNRCGNRPLGYGPRSRGRRGEAVVRDQTAIGAGEIPGDQRDRDSPGSSVRGAIGPGSLRDGEGLRTHEAGQAVVAHGQGGRVGCVIDLGRISGDRNRKRRRRDDARHARLVDDVVVLVTRDPPRDDEHRCARRDGPGPGILRGEGPSGRIRNPEIVASELAGEGRTESVQGRCGRAVVGPGVDRHPRDVEGRLGDDPDVRDLGRVDGVIAGAGTGEAQVGEADLQTRPDVPSGRVAGPVDARHRGSIQGHLADIACKDPGQGIAGAGGLGRGDTPVVDLGDRGHGDQLGGDGLGYRRRLGQGVVRSLGTRQAEAREGDGPGAGIRAGEGPGGGTRRQGDLANIRGDDANQGRAAGIHRSDCVPVVDLVRRGDPADRQGRPVDSAAPGCRCRQGVVGQEGGPGGRIVGGRQGHRHRPTGVGIARIRRIVGPGSLGDRGTLAGDPSADRIVGRGEGGRRGAVIGLGRVAGDSGQQAPRIDRPDGVGARRPRRRHIVPAIDAAEGDGGDGHTQSSPHILTGEARPGRRGDGHSVAGENTRQGVDRHGWRVTQVCRPVVGLDRTCDRQGTCEGRDGGGEAGRLGQAVVTGIGAGDGVVADRDRLVDPDILGVEQAGCRDVVEVHRIAGEETGPDDRG